MKIKSLLLLATSILVISACGTKSESESSKESESSESSSESSSSQQPSYWNGVYQNPLFVTNSYGNYYKNEIADPCVVRGDDGYIYCFATAGRVLRSEDGCEWEAYMENAIPRPTWGDGYAERPIIWAPDVVKIGDQWIYFYSLSAWGGPCGIGYATADEIAGPWTDQGKLFVSAEVGGEYSLGVSNSIDQQVIIDDDGSVYMVFGSFVGCYLVQLADDGMSLYGGIAYQREHKVLISGRPGGFDANHNYEGSWIFKNGDYWYYMGSVGSCCNGKSSTYHVLVGKSDSIMGPYIASDGRRLDTRYDGGAAGDLVIRTSDDENTIAPGHNAVIVDDAGDYWWYGHCFYEYDNYSTRHLAMDKIEWDENDMPYVDGQQLTYYEEIDGPQWLEG